MSHALPRWFRRLGMRTTGRIKTPLGFRNSRNTCLPGVEALENRTVLSVTVNSSFTALDFNQSGGYTPPDTCGAAGPAQYVETVNQEVAVYSPRATGASVTKASLSSFWFSTGALPRADSSSSLSDPIVVYDDQIGRFIVGDQDVNFTTHVSRFDIAVSTSSTPTTLSAADWKFYSISTTETGYDADYPGNFGYNHDAFVFTLNMFGSAGHAQIVSVNTTDLASGVAAPQVFKNDINDGSLRPTVMHDSVAGDPMWLVTEHGDNKSIDVIKMGNVLSSSASFTYTNLAVASYSGAVNPLNPNGTKITTNMDSRILKAAESSHTLVASHSVAVSSTEDDAQWYAVDVSGATPVLANQGRVSGGNKTYTIFPTVDINSSGQIGMTFMRSGNDTNSNYMSMYVTGRNSSDAAGTMQVPQLVPAGKGVANYKDFSSGGRAGDLSGINVDPVDGSFWAANEFANTEATANWGTAVANFSIGNPLASTDMSTTDSGPTGVDVSTGPATVTYTVTLTNNGGNAASGVVLTDTLPAGATFVSITPSSSNPDSFTFSQASGTLKESASGNIAVGSTDTFTLVVTAPASLGNGASFTNTTAVSAVNPDGIPSNNTAASTAIVTNNNANADLSVTVTGLTSSVEGTTVAYTISVKNNGPSDAANVTLTDSLDSLLRYISASPAPASVSGGIVSFSLGTIVSGATVNVTVNAQALEEGAANNTVSAASDTADPTAGNNTSIVKSTTFSEAPITVSAAINTRSKKLSNSQVATFTHASGIEATSAFAATINWGDGTSSAGVIGLSGTTYTVTGSHSYSGGNRHTITATVTETGNGAVSDINTKFGDDPGEGNWKQKDVVRLPYFTWLERHRNKLRKAHHKAIAKATTTHAALTRVAQVDMSTKHR